jgi:cell division protein FtsZ
MSGMGVAMMGTGTAEGDGRAVSAAQKAVSSPLLEDGSVNGARGVIINVTGGPDMSLMEVNEASSIIQEAAHEDANIIFGAVVDPKLEGKVKITVIATGFERKVTARAMPAAALQTPVDLSNYTSHLARAAGESTPADAPLPAGSGGLGPQPAGTYVPPPITIGRRPTLDLTLAPSPSSSAGSSQEHSLDLDSPLDVPAFLRRQS